jgi:hypothetical protein
MWKTTNSNGNTIKKLSGKNDDKGGFFEKTVIDHVLSEI